MGLAGGGRWTLTDEQVEGWLRREAETIYHPTCTARIGTSPADSVVDPQLRGHGVDWLRICDASVFPRIPSGHTTAPFIAVAEKGADLIRLALAEREAWLRLGKRKGRWAAE